LEILDGSHPVPGPDDHTAGEKAPREKRKSSQQNPKPTLHGPKVTVDLSNPKMAGERHGFIL